MRIVCKIFLLVYLFSVNATAAVDYTKYDHMYDGSFPEVYDPYETINRKIFNFNSTLDRLMLRPVAVGYDRITNDYTKGRVANFIENISVTPLTTANYALQMNLNGVLRSFWRLAINTTLGIGGLFDVATKFGVTTRNQNFGDTLAHYGVGPGPYIVLPIFGGTNPRDITNAIFTSDAFNPARRYVNNDFKLVVDITKTIHDRARLLRFTDYVEQSSVDPYVTIRSSIYQNREFYVKYPPGFVYPTIKYR